MRFVFYSSLSKRYQRLADKVTSKPCILSINGLPYVVIKGGQIIAEVTQ